MSSLCASINNYESPNILYTQWSHTPSPVPPVFPTHTTKHPRVARKQCPLTWNCKRAKQNIASETYRARFIQDPRKSVWVWDNLKYHGEWDSMYMGKVWEVRYSIPAHKITKPAPIYPLRPSPWGKHSNSGFCLLWWSRWFRSRCEC